MVSPRLLGFRFGGFGGSMKVGDAGAEYAWDGTAVAVWGNVPSRGNGDPNDCLCVPEVLSDRFLVFRIFLFGESERLENERCPAGLAGRGSDDGASAMIVEPLIVV